MVPWIAFNISIIFLYLIFLYSKFNINFSIGQKIIYSGKMFFRLLTCSKVLFGEPKMFLLWHCCEKPPSGTFIFKCVEYCIIPQLRDMLTWSHQTLNLRLTEERRGRSQWHDKPFSSLWDWLKTFNPFQSEAKSFSSFECSGTIRYFEICDLTQVISVRSKIIWIYQLWQQYSD